METIVISLGSNCGNRENMVSEALGWLSMQLSEFRSSTIYETAALGGKGGNYINAVAIGLSDRTLSDFNKICKTYEESHGRNAETRKLGMVPIDIDVVIYGNDILRERDFKSYFFIKGYSQLSHSQ